MKHFTLKYFFKFTKCYDTIKDRHWKMHNVISSTRLKQVSSRRTKLKKRPNWRRYRPAMWIPFCLRLMMFVPASIGVNLTSNKFSGSSRISHSSVTPLGVVIVASMSSGLAPVPEKNCVILCRLITAYQRCIYYILIQLSRQLAALHMEKAQCIKHTDT